MSSSFLRDVLKDPLPDDRVSLYTNNMHTAQKSLMTAGTVKDQDHAVKIWAKNAKALAEEDPSEALEEFQDLCADIGMPRTKEIMQSGKERSRRLVFAAFNVMKEIDADFFSNDFPLVKNWGTEVNKKHLRPHLKKPSP